METKFKTLAQLVFFCIASFSFCPSNSFAQSLSNYSFSSTSGTYGAILGTSASLSGGNTDDGYYNNIPIGFDFWYMGVRYTTISVSTNGWITLGQNITNSAPTNALSTGGNRPVIAPLWDDLQIYPGVLGFLLPGTVSYTSAGTVGSRILTVQWAPMSWNNTSSNDVISFQVKLYEANGKVEFIYNRGASSVVSGSASVGITAGSGVYSSLNGTGTTPTALSNTETSGLNVKPANGQTYSFTSSVTAAPTSLTFTMVGSTGLTLNWVDNASDEIAYVVYASTDATTYTYLGQVPANSIGATVTGLTSGLTYSYKIYALRETLSTALSGSQVANCATASISQIPTGNIVGIYRLDGNANDANGGANPGALQGAPTATTDRFGVASKAYTFNGTSQYVSTTNAYTNPNDLTISIWFKSPTTNLKGGKLIGFGKSKTGQSTNYDRQIYMDSDGHIVFGVNPGPIKTLITTEAYNDGNWHHAVATLSSTAGTALYLDGILKGSDATVKNGENYTGYWRLGYDNLTDWTPLPTSFYFTGSLDDAIIYHRVLSGSEISTLYKSPDGAGNNGPVCVGATLTLSAANLPGATYSWSGPNGFTSALQNPTLPYALVAAGVYTVTATLNGCSSTAYTIVTSTGVGQWTGNTSTGWAVAANWCIGTVPIASTNAVIPGSLTNYPVVSTTQPVNNLNIASGAAVTVTGGTLQIAGAITSSGTFTVSAGGIEMNGASPQQIPASVFAGNLIKNLTINNSAGVTLNGTLRLTSLLNNAAGVFTTGDHLTLASTASETASVLSVPSGASIRGSVTVERFLSGGTMSPYRTYRMLSSPVYDNTTTFINSNVAGNRTYAFAQFIDDIIITGPSGATNGFDATTGNTSTAFTYNSNYVAITNIENTLNIGQGAYIFFRGNRSNFTAKTNTPFANPEDVTLTFKGILNQQSVSVALNYGTASNGKVGFNLIGNPYAAAIDWDSSNWASGKVNINNSVWIWNPASRSYATYKAGVGTMGGSRYIGSGQSFFVQSTSTGGSVTFNENIKASTPGQQPSTLLLSMPTQSDILGNAPANQTLDEAQLKLLRIKLKKTDTFNEDETAIVFRENSSAAFDNEDATHFDGEGVFLSSLSSDLTSLAINSMPKIELVSYIDLNVNATVSGNYTLSFNLTDFPTGYTLKLRDSLLNTVTTVTPNLVYAFSIDKAVALSFGVSRFRLLIEPQVTLPVSLTSFTATKETNGVKLKWSTNNETNNDYFIVERTADSEGFVNVGKILANGVGNYELLDRTPVQGTNYYLLKQFDKDGKSETFGPISIKYGLSSANGVVLNLYPNPVVNDFTIKYNGEMSNVSHTLKISNTTGQKTDLANVTKDELNNGYLVNATKFMPGIYLVEIYETSSGKKLGTVKMIKQ